MDLTFDYDFRRVQRDMSDTLLWIDFSNEPEYLDRVVDEPARRKKVKRRGLNGVSGSHKRWLEEEWRKDAHLSNLAPEELHRRWFGEDVIDFPDETFILEVIDQRVTCTNLDAKPEFKAETSVNVNVNYSLTLIATIGTDKLLRCLEFTIGPNFKLMGRREGDATLGVSFEATAKLAEWDTRQTYLAENDEWVPKSDKNPKNDGTHVLKAPEFNWDFTLNGHVTAHVELTITFCIDEDDALQSLSKRAEIYGPLVPRVSGLLCLGNLGLPNSSLTRRLEDLGLYDDVHGVFNIPDPELAGHLEKRKPEEKVLTECGIAIKKLNAPDTDTDQYVTEHVYEAHLLTRFTELLIDGNNGALPAGHAKASRQSPGWKGSSLFFETTFGLGGNHNKPGLALAYKVMNNRKKTQFEEGTLDSRVSASNLQNRKDPRDIFGVFSYMKDNGIVGTYLDIDIEEW
ncbi:hypothetical protein MCOR29_006650 [Pyricularia oryzae]|nr:hypothetical protein MCOR34_008553 [Pyricularia oryzae]KAI6316620.1 hypothetical protein MCOR29_006650 [Pyricularia oryzae]KAI6456123.1 hypothetical protein MCOR15_007383 [Pyricularia oryzae]KAI6509648.1 hypothetical protein MCOR13_001546 [Pyricularia oryzae]